MRKIYVFAVLLLILFGCKTRHNANANRAFYYWKSEFALEAGDRSCLKELGVGKLYLHFFDVGWNNETNRVIPEAKVVFKDKFPGTLQCVPVIFIANKALEKTPADSISGLSQRIMNGVKFIATENAINYKELQVDCDWTEFTREKYFNLVSQLHSVLNSSGIILSATIRLHQIKYAGKTGIPPVDRGMLMFYNMGKINGQPGYNSIYNKADADRYTNYIREYKLPLDVALPIFSWALHLSNGPVEIIEKVNTIDDSAQFTACGNNIFVSHNSFFWHGSYLLKGDTVKIESVSPLLCLDAANDLIPNLKDENRTVTLFAYDSSYIKDNEKKDLEKIYSVFGN